MAVARVLLAVTVLGAFLASGDARQCYKCEHAEECGDPYEPKESHSVLCPAGMEYCVKTIIKISEFKNTKRNCANSVEKPSGSTDRVFTCNTDLCNGSVDLGAPYWLGLLTLLGGILVHSTV